MIADVDITIIGFGVVGQALYSSINLNKLDNPVNIYDGNSLRFNKFSKVAADKLTGDAHVVFICVNTPSTIDGQDSGDIVGILKILKDSNFKGLIVIKSTVLYINIEEFILSRLNIVYSPEFLSANHAVDDFHNQNCIILGGPTDLTTYAMHIFQKYFHFMGNDNGKMNYEFTSIKEAIHFKYVRNAYQAYKVLFWEFVQDTTGNARKMSKLLDQMPIDENSQISMDGYRGFGGACLPKDVRALEGDSHHVLTDFMLTYNKQLQGGPF